MPLVQYVVPTDNIRVTRKFGTPADAGNIMAWYRAARKMVKEMPNLHVNEDGWRIAQQDFNRQNIYLVLQDHYGNKAHVVIDRTAPEF
jgi:hypothetical protein